MLGDAPRSLTRGMLGELLVHRAALVRRPFAAPALSCHNFTQPWRVNQRQQQHTTATAAAASEAAVRPAGDSNIIETELRLEAEQSYLAYAMSVIVGRALPDVRDGLKPVHRRILYAMHELGLQHSKPFRKCARVVGEVLGKFHPHGDTAVYDALVRLAQDFSMRAPLVDGHGNFGSLDDDPPAAMRYTECRLQSLASSMLLADLEADTVDFVPNFDASMEEPSVLPARVPNLLVNGAGGIAVGIATKIPPHNLGEVVAGLKALIRDPGITVPQLMRHIPAPDFPTGGEIVMSNSVLEAYSEGRGGILVRAKMHIEDGGTTTDSVGSSGKKKPRRAGGNGRPLVVITELPYQTNKAALVEQVARLVDAGTITGVSDVRDESDRDGMRVVVEVKRGSSPEMVHNQLLKHTSVQSRFSCNMVALVGATPRTLTLKDFLQHFLDFRCEVVERRARFELRRAQKRLHLVDGYLRAMHSLDAVVEAIRRAEDAAQASQSLQQGFGLSREQAEGVLGLTLRRLTSLEAGKLREEQGSLQATISDLTDMLQSRERVLQVVEQEAQEIAAKYGTPRRTAIVTDVETELRVEDVIPNTPSLIVYSRRGYIKRMRAEAFNVQKLRGRGKAGARLKDDDSVDDVVSVHDHDHLLFLTEDGRAYTLRAYDIPEGSRTAIGTAIAQVLPVDKGASLAAMLPVAEFSPDMHLIMLTRGGQIKRTPLAAFSNVTARGLAAMALKEGDKLQYAALCSPTDSLLITASDGMTLHFRADKLRPQSRTAQGIRAMNLRDGSQFVAMNVLPKGAAPEEQEGEEEQEAAAAEGAEGDGSSAAGTPDADGACLLLLTAKGLGKRVPVSHFKLRSRVGQGLSAIKLHSGDRVTAALVVGGSPAAAAAAAAGQAQAEEDVLVSTALGLLIRLPLAAIPVKRRTGKGQILVKPQEGDEAATLTVVKSEA